jgi:sugar phosphate permease
VEKANKAFRINALYLIIFSFTALYINIGLVVDGMNVLYPALEAKFGWTRGALGGATSIAVYLSIVAAVLAGTLMMKFDIKKIVIPAALLLGADVVVMSRITNFQGFAICMILLQILSAVLMLGTMAIVTNWFRKKRGVVMGIVTIGCPLASATFVMIGTKVTMAMGFEFFYTCVGIFVMVLGILGGLFLKNHPEEIGCGADGDPIIEEESNRDHAMKGKSLWSFSTIMKNKEMWLISLTWGMIFLMMTGIMSSAIPRFMDVGIPLEKGLWFFSIAALMGMPASYMWGWLDDKLGTPKTCMIFGFAYILGSVCFLFGSAEHIWVSFGGVVAIALTTGGMPNLQPSIQAWVYGRKEFVATGRYTGVFHNIFRGSAFAFMGIIFTTFGSYDAAYIVFIFMAVLTIILFAMIKTTYDPENPDAKPIPGSEERVPAGVTAEA